MGKSGLFLQKKLVTDLYDQETVEGIWFPTLPKQFKDAETVPSFKIHRDVPLSISNSRQYGKKRS